MKYLVMSRYHGQDYFTTDCDWNTRRAAINYACSILASVSDVEEVIVRRTSDGVEESITHDEDAAVFQCLIRRREEWESKHARE